MVIQRTVPSCPVPASWTAVLGVGNARGGGTRCPPQGREHTHAQHAGLASHAQTLLHAAVVALQAPRNLSTGQASCYGSCSGHQGMPTIISASPSMAQKHKVTSGSTTLGDREGVQVSAPGASKKPAPHCRAQSNCPRTGSARLNDMLKTSVPASCKKEPT